MSGTPVTPGFAAMKLNAGDASPASTYAGSEATGVTLELSHVPDDGEGVLLVPVARAVAKTEETTSVKSNNAGSQAAKASGSDDSKVKRYTPPFVRNGQRSPDDPFQSPKAKWANSKTATGKKASNALSLDNWRSSSGSSHCSNSSAASLELSKSEGKKPATETGTIRIGHFVGGSAGQEFSTLAQVPLDDVTAQDTSSCSVFVANLLKTATDEKLQTAVADVFGDYGTVEVKVRRDGRDMPYAFVQYSSESDASRAIEFGRNRTILGRKCRCERANANRTYLVESRTGATLVPAIIRDIMSRFGQVDACYSTTLALREEHSLGDGVIVRFRTYDAGQAANIAMRTDDELKMRPAPSLQVTPPRVPPAPPVVSGHSPTVDEVDSHSIFVGNIHQTTKDSELVALFSEFGRIENVQRYECPSKYEPGTQYYFGFVEFKYRSSVQPAIRTMHFYNFHGKILKVQRKKSNLGPDGRPIITPPSVPRPYQRSLQQMQPSREYAVQQSQQYAQPAQQYSQQPQQFAQQSHQYAPQQPQQYMQPAPVTYMTPPHVPAGLMSQYNGYTYYPDVQQFFTPPPTFYHPYASAAAYAQQAAPAPPLYYNPAVPAQGYAAPTPYVQYQQYYTPPAGSLAAVSDERVETPTPAGGQTGAEGEGVLGGATL